MGKDLIDWSEEFQDRRAKTWARTRSLIPVAIVSAIFGSAFGKVDDTSAIWKIGFVIISWAVCGISMLVVAYWLSKLYRCPSCDEIPMGRSEGELLLNPKLCPRCSVLLKR